MVSTVSSVANLLAKSYGKDVFTASLHRAKLSKLVLLRARRFGNRHPLAYQLFAPEITTRPAPEITTRPSPESAPRNAGFARTAFMRDRLGKAIEDNYIFIDTAKPFGVGQAQVAYHKLHGRKVAVQTIEKSRLEEADALTREIEFLSAADHTNLIRLFETFQDEFNVCIVLEFCEGGDLHDHIRSKHGSGLSFDEKEIVQIAKDMLQAISYCHKHSIVHGELRPANFAFAARLKLVDFRCVSAIVPPASSANAFIDKLSKKGYIAPEVLESRQSATSPAADMFSLGATLFHVITGQTPVWLPKVGNYNFPQSPHLQKLSTDGSHLLKMLLSANPSSRPTASEALEHPWLVEPGEIKNEALNKSWPSTAGKDEHSITTTTQRRSQVNHFRVNGAQWVGISPPEFESEDDRAQEIYLPRPGDGGFARSSFVWDRLGHAIEDKYVFHDELEKATMSKVMAACHRRSGRKVVIKIATKNMIEQSEALKRELEFLKVADHPNVVRLLETFEDESKLCLVLEYCDGGDLWDHIRSKHESGAGFDEEELVKIMRDMLRAVAYCHRRSIVHRDIKPSNFMFKMDHVKLVDFGVSGVVPRFNPSGRFLKVKTGTDGYIAPEILESRPYGPPADIFSLGATLVHMISGRPPEWLPAVGHYSYPKTSHTKRLSTECKGFLSMLLKEKPKSRPTASEALAHPWLSSATLPQSTSTILDPAEAHYLRHYGKRSKLQRCARTGLVSSSSLCSPELIALQSKFLDINKSNNGEIDREELQASLRLTNSLEAASLIESMDSSCDGFATLSFSEWLAAASSPKLFSCREQAQHAFNRLDSDGDGLISASDLLEALPEVFKENEVGVEIQRYDIDGDGVLCFDEFYQLLQEEVQ